MAAKNIYDQRQNRSRPEELHRQRHRSYFGSPMDWGPSAASRIGRLGIRVGHCAREVDEEYRMMSLESEITERGASDLRDHFGEHRCRVAANRHAISSPACGDSSIEHGSPREVRGDAHFCDDACEGRKGPTHRGVFVESRGGADGEHPATQRPEVDERTPGLNFVFPKRKEGSGGIRAL